MTRVSLSVRVRDDDPPLDTQPLFQGTAEEWEVHPFNAEYQCEAWLSGVLPNLEPALNPQSIQESERAHSNR